jgi:hypothetical protein
MTGLQKEIKRADARKGTGQERRTKEENAFSWKYSTMQKTAALAVAEASDLCAANATLAEEKTTK